MIHCAKWEFGGPSWSKINGFWQPWPPSSWVCTMYQTFYTFLYLVWYMWRFWGVVKNPLILTTMTFQKYDFHGFHLMYHTFYTFLILFLYFFILFILLLSKSIKMQNVQNPTIFQFLYFSLIKYKSPKFQAGERVQDVQICNHFGDIYLWSSFWTRQGRKNHWFYTFCIMYHTFYTFFILLGARENNMHHFVWIRWITELNT